MRKHLKKYFIPHKKNNYHPHIFRNASVFTIISICVFLLGVSYGNSVFLRETVMGANIATNVLIDLANENRTQNHIQPLKKNEKLAVAAVLKAGHMIENQYFAHFSPDGTTPWYFINKAGYEFSYAGENLAINFTDPEKVDQAWMDSPLHRGNLLNSNFKEVGVAAVDGKYDQTNSVYVVQMFGAPAIVEKVPVDIPEQIETKSKPVKIIQEDKNFIAAKNIASTTSVAEPEVLGIETNVEKYSSWKDKIVFDGSFYVELFLIIILLILVVGVLLRIFIEYKRQHYRHLIFSMLFMLFVLVLASLNLNLINSF
jgi:hypothetical protein